MYQALHRVLNDPADGTEVTLLYGSKTESDILLRAELDELATNHPAQLKLHYVLSDEAAEGWTGEVGLVDQEKIERLCPGPAADTLVFVCGVPPMYETLCGPRGEAELPDGTVLKTLGYTQEMVSKF
jgi:cytochrome-b5 reductase